MRGPLGRRSRIHFGEHLTQNGGVRERERPSDLLDRYLAGEVEFWTFNAQFMEIVLAIMGRASIPFDTRNQALDDMYELVYMAGPDPVSAEGQNHGIIG